MHTTHILSEQEAASTGSVTPRPQPGPEPFPSGSNHRARGGRAASRHSDLPTWNEGAGALRGEAMCTWSHTQCLPELGFEPLLQASILYGLLASGP